MSESEREKTLLLNLDFTKITDPKSQKGLVTVVVQDISTMQVLMVAYSDEKAVKKMIETGQAAFFSRTRQCAWVKGESSGNTMKIIKMLVDCDQDTILLLVEPQGEGMACHVVSNITNKPHKSCFFRRVDWQRSGDPKPLILLTSAALSDQQ
jgi:phosphoribosyl-AMP cyclohydrolase